MRTKISILAVSVLSLLVVSLGFAHQETRSEGPPQGGMGMGMWGGGMRGMIGCGMGGMIGGSMRGMMGGGMGGMMAGYGMGDPICGVLHQFGGPGFAKAWAARLDLSEDQQTKLERIWTTHMKVAIQKRAALQIAQLDLKVALDEDAPNFQAVKSGISQINRQREEIALDHLDAIQKARRVLTSDQLKKLKSLKDKPWGAGQGMMGPPQEGQESPGGMMGGRGMH